MLIIHPLTIIYILLALIFNRFNGILFLYIFGLIHELSHVFVAKIFKIRTKEIIMYPTGFNAKIEDIYLLHPIKQLLILISGPASYFISLLLIKLLFEVNLISSYGLRLAQEYNMMILLFNIIPIYPLDGGKIIDIHLAHFFNEFHCRIIRIVLSCILVCLLLFVIKTLGDALIIGFILIGFISQIVNFKRDYLLFLIKKRFSKENYKDKINKKLTIFRFRNNYYFDKTKFFNQNEIIDKIYQREKDT